MPRQIFVNLPVYNLDESTRFFKRLGFTFNPQFSDETAACMIITNDIYIMLLAHAKFKEFTNKDIADAHKTTEVLTCISLDSRDEVNALVDKAVAAGGSEAREPMDFGFMFGRSFNDLDGHIWEIIWMDPGHVQAT